MPDSTNDGMVCKGNLIYDPSNSGVTLPDCSYVRKDPKMTTKNGVKVPTINNKAGSSDWGAKYTYYDIDLQSRATSSNPDAGALQYNGANMKFPPLTKDDVGPGTLTRAIGGSYDEHRYHDGVNPIVEEPTTEPLSSNDCGISKVIVMDHSKEGAASEADLSDADVIGTLLGNDIDSSKTYVFTGTPESTYAMAVQLAGQSNPGDSKYHASTQVVFSGSNESEHTENLAPYVLNGDDKTFAIDDCEIQTYTISSINKSDGSTCASVQLKIQVQSSGGVCDSVGDNKVVSRYYIH